ncbi:MAG: KR domain-containing protein, partial [Myxococcota bacterium]
ADGIDTLWQRGIQIFIEIGPSPALSRLIRTAVAGDPEVSALPSACPDTGEWAQLVDTVARLHLRGVELRWDTWMERYRGRVAEAPSYPFQRRRIWPEEPEQAAAPAPSSVLARRSDLTDWGYAPSWSRSAPMLRDIRPAEAIGALVLARGRDGDRLTAAMAAAGRTVIRSADWSETELTARVADLMAGGSGPKQIVVLASAREGGQDRDRARPWGAYDALVTLTRILVERGDERQVQLVAVTRGVHDVVGEEPLAPGLATVLGPCLVIPQEYSWIRCRNVDIPASGADESDDDDRFEWLVTELAADAAEPVVAHRGRHRWVLGAQPSPLLEPPPERSLLRPGVAHAVIGRLRGGLGAVFARYLHDRTAAPVVVIGPDVSAAADHPESVAIAELRAAGVDLVTFAAELDDEAAMTAALAAAEDRCGRIAGVFHASWLGRPELARAVAQIDDDHTLQLFRDRVLGLPVLESVLRGREPDFCLVQSSLSTVVGGLGFAAYAAANAFVDAHVSAAARRSSYPWLSVAWEAYQGELTGALTRTKLGAEIAELALSDRDIAAALDRILVRGRSGALIVSPGELTLRRERAHRRPAPNRPQNGAGEARDPSLHAEYAPPENEIERTIVAIWEEFMAVRPIGINDDYFALGGNSLAAVQILARVKARFDVEVPLNALLGTTPTIAHIGLLIRELQAEAKRAEPAELDGPGAPTDTLAEFAANDELAQITAMIDELPPEEALRLLDESTEDSAGVDPSTESQRTPRAD